MGLRADTARARIDITSYHPDFLFVPDETRLALTDRVLDWALGEDDVARWVGEVTTATDEPMDALPPSMLPPVVEQIPRRSASPPGWSARAVRRWGTPRGWRCGSRCTGRTIPLCDLYVSVALPYATVQPRPAAGRAVRVGAAAVRGRHRGAGPACRARRARDR